MDTKKWDDLILEIKQLLLSGNAVFVGVHQNISWKGLGSLITQLGTGYYCHAQYISHVVSDEKDISGLPVGAIASVCADGVCVKWYDFISQYSADVISGDKKITIGYIADATVRDKIDKKIVSTVGSSYSWDDIIRNGAVVLLPLIKNIGTWLAGQLDRQNFFHAKNTYDCSADCAAGVLEAYPDAWPDINPDNITPTQFMSAKIIKIV
jgi:hypothetical protein